MMASEAGTAFWKSVMTRYGFTSGPPAVVLCSQSASQALRTEAISPVTSALLRRESPTISRHASIIWRSANLASPMTGNCTS